MSLCVQLGWEMHAPGQEEARVSRGGLQFLWTLEGTSVPCSKGDRKGCIRSDTRSSWEYSWPQEEQKRKWWRTETLATWKESRAQEKQKRSSKGIDHFGPKEVSHVPFPEECRTKRNRSRNAQSWNMWLFSKRDYREVECPLNQIFPGSECGRAHPLLHPVIPKDFLSHMRSGGEGFLPLTGSGSGTRPSTGKITLCAQLMPRFPLHVSFPPFLPSLWCLLNKLIEWNLKVSKVYPLLEAF